MVGKKHNLSHLTDEERDQIMNVLQKDFELRRHEKKRIHEVREELVKEKSRIAVLKDKEKFNDNSCIICLERFGVFFNRKRQCSKCDLNVCSECSQARDKKKKGFICKVCSKEKAFKMLSNEWFYTSSHKTDKHIGSSKIAQWLHKKSTTDPLDTDVDSGYIQSSCSSAGPVKQRPRLENVFDIRLKENDDEERSQQSSGAIRLSLSDSVETLPPDQTVDPHFLPPSHTDISLDVTQDTYAETSRLEESPVRVETPQVVPRMRTSVQSKTKSQSETAEVPEPRKRQMKEYDDKEAIDRTRMEEESKFRVAFNKLLGDLYENLADEDLDGNIKEAVSHSYEEMMQQFSDNVVHLLQEFKAKLQAVYDERQTIELKKDIGQTVQQDLCKFIAKFLGENTNMTSDADIDDIFFTANVLANEESSLEDLLAQVMVSKLFENHYMEVSNALLSSKNNTKDPDSRTYSESENGVALSVPASDDGDIDNVDEKNQLNKTFDVNVDIEELKEFVKKTPQRPRIALSAVDDSRLCEVNEDTLVKIKVDLGENKDDFYAKYSMMDRVDNPSLPDNACFTSEDYDANEVDPDLLSLSLASIPEETEEEVEPDIEKKNNWFFKGKGLIALDNLPSANEHASPKGSLRMRVPIPENIHIPKIGSSLTSPNPRGDLYFSDRNIDQLSDFSDVDGSDDEEENTFYANTSTELARIAKQRGRLPFMHQLSDCRSEESDFTDRCIQHQVTQKTKTDISGSSDGNSGPELVPVSQDIKLLENLIPAENNDPIFLVAPESVTTQEGEPVKLSCRVGGTGHIDVFWYRESDEVEELEDSSDVDISCEGDNHSIVLYNLKKQTGGQYICIAMNEKGKTIQYLVVTVKDNKQEMKRPEFLKGLKDVDVTEGQSVKFRVKVKGYPQPRVCWYKDGKCLKSTRLCRIEKFGNRDYTLVIDHASMNDDAEYSAVARNVAGEVRTSAQLIVEPQSDLPARKQNMSSTTTSGVSDSDSDRPLSYQSIMLGRNYGHSTPISSSGTIQISVLSASTSEIRPLSTIAGESNTPTLINELRTSPATAEEARTSSSLTACPTVKQSDNQVTTSQGRRDSPFAQKQTDIPESTRLLTADAHEILQIADDIIQMEHQSVNDTRRRFSAEVLDSTTERINNNDMFSKTASSSQRQLNDCPSEELYLPDSLDDYVVPPPSDQTQHNEGIIVLENQQQPQATPDKLSRDFEIALPTDTTRDTQARTPELNRRQNSTDKTNDTPPGPGTSTRSSQGDSQVVSIVTSASVDQEVNYHTEVSKNSCLLLPSVDKLKEVFSAAQDEDDIEPGTLRRVHSITARNVPREHLESLRSSVQSHSSPSSSTNKSLKASESSSPTSTQIIPESQITPNKSSASSDTRLQLTSSPPKSTSSSKRISLQLPSKETFTTLDSQKEPVLIYLKTNVEDTQQQQQKNQSATLSIKVNPKTGRLVFEPDQQKSTNQTSSKATKHISSREPKQGQQSKISNTAEHVHHNDSFRKSIPRIKGGCISARTAFWERKIAYGDEVNQEEFPDMVESHDV